MLWSEAVTFSQDDKRDSLLQRNTFVQQATGTSTPMTGTSQLQLTCYERWLEGSFTIIPEGNVFIDMWDMVVISALCVTALLLPWEVALINSPPQNLFVLDRCIDGIFLIDMICSFNLAFASTHVDSRGLYEKRPIQIAKHYMAVPFSQNFEAGWFWPDLLTLIPWEMVSSVKGMRSLRLVRVLRLVRMFRLVRVIKLFKRWHTHVGFSFSSVKVLSTLLVTLLLVHWLACWWAHLGQNQSAIVDSERDVTTWLEAWAGREAEGLSDSKVYINSLYLCCVVLTTVGFGDITPKADIEYIAMVVTIFLTALTWAWVVANVVKVITEADAFGNIFNEIMDDLNRLMGTRGVHNRLRYQVRKHLYASASVSRTRHETASLSWVSSSLQGEIAIQSGIERSLKTIWYLRELSPMILTDLAVFFAPDIFSPKEFIMDPNSVTVICKGTCTRRGSLLQKNSVFGEDMILATEELKDTSCPKTLTFVEVLRLSKRNLAKVCERYSEFDHKIRKAQIKLAVWRSFIHRAQKIKRTQAAWEKKRNKGGTRRSKLSIADIARMVQEKEQISKKGWSTSMVPGASPSENKAGAEMFNKLQDLKILLKEREAAARRFSQRVESIGQQLEERRAETENTFDGLEMRLMDTWKEMQKTQEKICGSNGIHGER